MALVGLGKTVCRQSEERNNFVFSKYMLSPGVDHDTLTQVGEQFLNIRSGAGAEGTKAQYRGGERCNSL